MTRELGQSRARIIVDIVSNIKSVHTIDTNKEHMLDVA